MVVSICQPHFLPWIGYFNMIHKADMIIFLDNVNYNRRSWQNRVKIIDSTYINSEWISVSIDRPSQSKQINQLPIIKSSIDKILFKIYNNYKNHIYFKENFNFIKKLIEKKDSLVNLNINIIVQLCNYFNIDLTFDYSSNFNSPNYKDLLILDILKHCGASTYLANNGVLSYTDGKIYEDNGIIFKLHNFIHPQYNQYKNLSLVSGLSVIDMIFNLGVLETSRLIKK